MTRSANARLASELAEGGDGLDFTERAGFMVGRSAALADWKFRKEEDAFKALCLRLYHRNWARKERQRNPERVRARLNAWRAKNREKVNAQDRARRAAKRVPRIIECVVCRTRKRVRAIVKDGPNATKFCSRRCRNQYHGVPRARARNRGIRCMTIVPQILEVLAAAPPEGLELKAIAARLPGCKYGSIATTLTALFQAGRVVRVGTFGGRGAGKHGRRYLLPARSEAA